MKFVIDIPDGIMNKDVIQDTVELVYAVDVELWLRSIILDFPLSYTEVDVRVLKDSERVVEGLTCKYKPGDKVIWNKKRCTVSYVIHQVPFNTDGSFSEGDNIVVEIELEDDDDYSAYFVTPDDDDLSHAKKDVS